jgi:uncharacterized RDD family membrane protein YckC
MKSRFELDQGAEGHASEARLNGEFSRSELTNSKPIESESIERRYVDPESLAPDSYDASERHFAISLGEYAPDSCRFVVEDHQHSDNVTAAIPNSDKAAGMTKQRDSSRLFGHELNQLEPDNGVPWRQEVSARLTKYQARRRVREPRYPSLQLKFETQEAWRSSPPEELHPAPVPNTLALAKSTPTTTAAPIAIPPCPLPSESSSRIIEFPRSSIVVPSHSEELAEPVFVRPRIMEAPELVPDAPALGGILIEPMDAPVFEKRPGFEMPLQSARMARRLAATLIDATIVCAGLALFACVFWQATAMVPSIRAAAPTLVVVASMLWAAYQYLLIVHCGTTPGLKLAKLKLSHFDGTTVQRKRRRWRVLASILSGLSLGLGYAWCFLDEDQLCWHDRITRTYIAPKA